MEKYNPTTTSIFESSETSHNFPLMMNMMNPHDELDDDQYRRNNGFPSNSTAAAVEINGNAAMVVGSENEAKPGKIKGEKKSIAKKQPKYAFQTRSQVDILDDGYRWRKYGQKAVKNNKFPRSYYRCTHQGCNVKKQIQRLSKDEEIVVTTYEGVHSHPIHNTTDNFQHILSQMQIYTAPTY